MTWLNERMKNTLLSPRNLFFILALALLFALTIFTQQNSAAQSAAVTSEQVTQALAIDLDEVEWGPRGGGNGSPVGVRTARQGVDLLTGGITYYAEFPAGSHFDLHWHTHDEFVVVVSGNVTIVLGEESHDLQIGSYVVIPGKLNHSWDVPAGGEAAVILVRRAGPADFNFVDR